MNKQTNTPADNTGTQNKEFTKVTKDNILGEVIYKYPDTAEIFLSYGLHCVGCFANTFDTIEVGSKIHDLSDEEIQEMVDRVNEFIEFGE